MLVFFQQEQEEYADRIAFRSFLDLVYDELH